MKTLFSATLFLLILISQPTLTKAGGIPVFDGINLGTAIEDMLLSIEEIAEVVNVYEQVHGYYETYLEARAEWEEILDWIKLKELLKEYGMKYLKDSITKDFIEPAIDPVSIWGDEMTPAREIYEKSIGFVHETIGKVDEVHKAIVERKEKIEELLEDLEDKTTEKQFMSFQSHLQIEQLAMQNESMLIDLLQTEFQMGVTALELEESAKMQVNLMEVNDVH